MVPETGYEVVSGVRSVCLCTQACARTLSCSVVSDCDFMDYSPPGSSVQGIFQARVLERVAISYARGSSRPRHGTLVSCISCVGGWVFLPLRLGIRSYHSSLLAGSVLKNKDSSSSFP